MTTPQFIPPVNVPNERDLMVNDVRADVAAWTPLADGRGDPVYSALETVADYAADKVAQADAAGLQTLLAYATGNFLDLIGAITDTPRHAGEADAAYRLRIPLGLYDRTSGSAAYVRRKALEAADYVHDAASDRIAGRDKITVYLLTKPAGAVITAANLNSIVSPAADGADLLAVQTYLRRPEVQEGWVVYSAAPAVIADYTVNALLTIDGNQDALDAAVRAELNAYFLRTARLNRSVNAAGVFDAIVEYLLPNQVLNASLQDPTILSPTAKPAEPGKMYRGAVGTLLYHHPDVPTFGFNYQLVAANYDVALRTTDAANHEAWTTTLPAYARGGIGDITYKLEGGPAASESTPLEPHRAAGENGAYLEFTNSTRVLKYVGPNRAPAAATEDLTGSYRYYAIDADGRRSEPIRFTITVAVT